MSVTGWVVNMSPCLHGPSKLLCPFSAASLTRYSHARHAILPDHLKNLDRDLQNIVFVLQVRAWPPRWSAMCKVGHRWGRTLPHLGDWNDLESHQSTPFFRHLAFPVEGQIGRSDCIAIGEPWWTGWLLSLQVGYVQDGSVSRSGTSKYGCYYPKLNYLFQASWGVPSLETPPCGQTEGEGKLFSSHTILHRSLLDWCTKARCWAIPVLREIQPTAVQPSTGDPWINQWSCIFFFDLYFIFFLFFFSGRRFGRNFCWLCCNDWAFVEQMEDLFQISISPAFWAFLVTFVRCHTFISSLASGVPTLCWAWWSFAWNILGWWMSWIWLQL